MAAVRRIKRTPYRPGEGDPFSVYEVQSLRALAMTMNDVAAGSIETRDAEQAYWLPLALMDAIEERCARLATAAKKREDAEYAATKDGA